MCFINCTEDEEPLYCHVYAWVRDSADSTGVDGLVLKVIDLDPDNLSAFRQNTVTTTTHDQLQGFFEIDSLVYGTDKRQGSALVTFVADTLDNPSWQYTVWHPVISGDVDTAILYISD
jgi:hypothetical protein